MRAFSATIASLPFLLAAGAALAGAGGPGGGGTITVPEPGTLAILAGGAGAAILLRSLRKKK